MAQQHGAVIALRDGIQVVDAERVLAREHKVGAIHLGAGAVVGEASANAQVVLEHIAERGANLERVVVAIDVFNHQILVVVEFALPVVGTKSHHPLTFGHKHHLVDITTEMFLPLGGKCAQEQEHYY